MIRKQKLLLGLALVAITGFAALRVEKQAVDLELASKMILIENEQEFVTSFTSEMLAIAARDTIDANTGTSKLPRARIDEIQAEFDRIALRNPYTNDAYVFLTLVDGNDLGAVLFSDADTGVTLSDQMVKLCGNDREMLLGILLHELAHRDLKHSRMRLIGAVPPELRTRLVFEEHEDAAVSIADHPEHLLAFAFGRAMENAARKYVDDRLSEMNVGNGGFERCLEVLEHNRDVPGVALFLTAHAIGEATRN
ncbi:hypothetical protein [Roseibium sp.]|uniref:hypothetical protein n=1 Tax=Roseibium sp. TaxID=1936156 RepID=UPI003A98509A